MYLNNFSWSRNIKDDRKFNALTITPPYHFMTNLISEFVPSYAVPAFSVDTHNLALHELRSNIFKQPYMNRPIENVPK